MCACSSMVQCYLAWSVLHQIGNAQTIFRRVCVCVLFGVCVLRAYFVSFAAHLRVSIDIDAAPSA